MPDPWRAAVLPGTAPMRGEQDEEALGEVGAWEFLVCFFAMI